MKITDIKISPINIDERKKIDLRSGDTVKIWQKIKEGEKTRLQVFEGLVLARKHGLESGSTFTVRKVTSGVGVEKTFPLFSPVIDKIEVIRRAKVRRAKLYHIRKKVAKEISREMRRIIKVDRPVESSPEAPVAEATQPSPDATAGEAETK